MKKKQDNATDILHMKHHNFQKTSISLEVVHLYSAVFIQMETGGIWWFWWVGKKTVVSGFWYDNGGFK